MVIFARHPDPSSFCRKKVCSRQTSLSRDESDRWANPLLSAGMPSTGALSLSGWARLQFGIGIRRAAWQLSGPILL